MYNNFLIIYTYKKKVIFSTQHQENNLPSLYNDTKLS